MGTQYQFLVLYIFPVLFSICLEHSWLDDEAASLFSRASPWLCSFVCPFRNSQQSRQGRDSSCGGSNSQRYLTVSMAVLFPSVGFTSVWLLTYSPAVCCHCCPLLSATHISSDYCNGCYKSPL